MRASLAGLCLLALAPRAEAAESRRRFAIAPKPFAEALIDLAVQANVSVLNVQACGEGGRAQLTGRYSLNEALGRILAGAPCAYRIVDAGTVRIVATRPQSHIVPASAPVVEELLVTARKRPERLDALPAGVSVVSGDQLSITNAYEVRATAGQLVGVLSTNLGPGRDKLLFRGLSDGAFTGRARSTVSTYLDDAPLNYNAPDPDLRLTDVARVETVRGPQGALYGSGALTGVYRIVTNTPDPDRFSTGAQATYATTRGGSPSYAGEGFANLPIAMGRAALRLVAYYDDQGGYLDDVSLRLSNVDTTLRAGARATLRLEVDPAWTVDLGLVAQRLSSRDTQYTTLSNSLKRANQVREASKNDFAQASLTVKGDLGWADLSASTSYVQHAYASLYDGTAQAVAFDAGASLGVYSESARIHRLVQDIVLTSPDAGAFSWLVGLYGSSSFDRTPGSLDIRANSTPITPLVTRGSGVSLGAPESPTDIGPTLAAQPPLTSVYNEDRRDRMSEAAFYGEASWRLAPGWTVTTGGRAFQTNLRVGSQIGGAPPTQPREIRQRNSFQGVSTKLSLQYQFEGQGPLLYGLFADGYRPGGVNTTNFLTIRPTRTTFDPDRLRNFEIGAKGEFLDRRLIVRAAAFYDLWGNIQSDQYRSSGLAYTANVGDAYIKGLEAETSYEAPGGITLQANALYSAPKFTRVNPDFAGALGSGLPGAPRWSGGALIRYDRPLPGSDLTLRLVAETAYTGPARLTFDPALSDRTDPVVEAQLLAEIAARRWTAGLFVSNPSNSSGNTFAYGNPFTFGLVHQVTPQRPRTIGLRLAAGF